MEEKDKKVCPLCNEVHEENDLHAISVMTADSMVKEVFPKFWNDAKSEIKDLSKKELAEEMFRSGAINMLYGYMKLMNEISDKHDNIEEK